MPKGEEIASIYLRMVPRVHIHSNNEPDLQDMNNDDNSKNQERDEKQVDCKKEDTTRSNEFGVIRKSSKKSQSNGEVGTSRSLGDTVKNRPTRDGHNQVWVQEATIPIIIKRP